MVPKSHAFTLLWGIFRHSYQKSLPSNTAGGILLTPSCKESIRYSEFPWYLAGIQNWHSSACLQFRQHCIVVRRNTATLARVQPALPGTVWLCHPSNSSVLLDFKSCEEKPNGRWKSVPGLSCLGCSYFSGQCVCAEVVGPIILPALPWDTDIALVPESLTCCDLLLWYL